MSDEHGPFSHYYLPRLRKWARGHGALYAENMAAMAAETDCITRLELRAKGMHDEDCAALAAGLEANGTLTLLDISGNDAVTAKGALAIAAAAADHPTLSELRVAAPDGTAPWAPWGDAEDVSADDAASWGPAVWADAAAAVEELQVAATRSGTLKAVVLPPLPQRIVEAEDEFDGDTSTRARTLRVARASLERARRCRELALLAAELNAGAPARWKGVALAAANNFTEVVSAELLCEDAVDKAPGAPQIATALPLLARCLEGNATLVRLDLSGYGAAFGDNHAALVGAVLRDNATVAEVALRHDAVSCSGAIAVADALEAGRNATLTELDLSGNTVADAAVDRFLALVRAGVCAVAYINVDGNCVTPTLHQRLHQALALNAEPPKLKELAPLLAADDKALRRVAFTAGSAKLNNGSCRILLQALRTNTHVTHLDLSNNHIGDEGAVHLAGIVTQCRNLKRLVVQFNHVGAEGASVLMAAMPRNPAIEDVDLRHQEPPLPAPLLDRLRWLSTLGAQPYDVKAKGLLLSQNDPSLSELVLASQDSSRRLGLEGIQLLLEVLGSNTAVDSVVLRGAPPGLDVPAVVPTLTGAFCARLTALDLSDNGLTDAVAPFFLDTLSRREHHARLKTLRLAGNDFSAAAAMEFCTVLREVNDVLTALDLHGNPGVGEEELEMVEHCCALNTHDRGFKTLVLRLTANAPELREVNLTQFERTTPMGTSHHFARRYGDASAKLLAASLERNTHLTSLSLAGHNIGNEGARHLGEMLKVNVGLTAVNLASNDLSDDGLRYLAAAVLENHQLRALVVDGNRRLGDPMLVRGLHISLQANAQHGGPDRPSGGPPPVKTAAVYNAALSAKRAKLNRAAHEERALETAIMADAMLDFKPKRPDVRGAPLD